MKRSSKKSKGSSVIHLPDHFTDLVKHKVVFSGNLTEYYHELVERMQKQGTAALLSDDCWEIPQMAGFDEDNMVVMLVIRNSDEYEIGEAEFLIASQDNTFIMHLNAYSDENVFFDDCFAVLHANFDLFRWESFVYNDDGLYEGTQKIEKLQGDRPRKIVVVDRVFDDQDDEED